MPPRCIRPPYPSTLLYSAPRAEHLADKLTVLLQRALGIDAATARYYVRTANNDLRQAMALFQEDKQWERAARRQGQRWPLGSMPFGYPLRRY